MFSSSSSYSDASRVTPCYLYKSRVNANVVEEMFQPGGQVVQGV
jgi:hypothetical protein